jgi:hypothetical protein
VWAHEDVHACVWKRNVFVRCVYMHICMRETLLCICACTCMCMSERNVFCWVQNIYLQHFCKVHLLAVQLVESQRCKTELLWCIRSKHDNNPQTRVMFQVTGFILRWEENMHKAHTEEKMHKISAHTVNALCIVKECL